MNGKDAFRKWVNTAPGKDVDLVLDSLNFALSWFYDRSVWFYNRGACSANIDSLYLAEQIYAEMMVWT